MPKRSKKNNEHSPAPQETVAAHVPPNAVNGVPAVPHETVDVAPAPLAGSGGISQPPWTKCRHEQQVQFILAFLACGDLNQACEEVGISRKTHYSWLLRHAEYREAWEESRDWSVRVLEDSLFDRAVNGWMEPVYGGIGDGITGEVGERRKFDNVLGLKMLERYKPSKAINQTPTDQPGQTINVFAQHATVSADERRANVLALISDEMRRRGLSDDRDIPAGPSTNGNGKH